MLVPDVADEAHHHPLVEDRDGEGEDRGDGEQAGVVVARDAGDDVDAEEEPEGGRDQHAEVALVEGEGFVERLAHAEGSPGIHGAPFWRRRTIPAWRRSSASS
jgi:hypothetical protein